MYLHPTQATVAKDLHRFRVLRCGRRWGKTMLISEEIKGLVLSGEKKIAYIANNYQQARDIIWEILKRELNPIIIDKNEARLEILVRTLNGKQSQIVLRGWESIENLRGQAFHFLAIDEVAMMSNFWVGWQEVLRPTLTDYKGMAMFTSTPKGYNHFFDLCNLELTDESFKTFHFTSYENPHLPKDEIDDAKRTLPEERFEQEYMASFEKTAGLVYKEFDRERHLYDFLPTPPLDKKYIKIGAIDFGYRNPAAVLDIRFDDEMIYVESEWYKMERTEIQIAEYVAGNKFDAVYPDPESPSAIEELRRKGINVREVVKGRDSIKSGIQKIRELLISGKIRINRKCVNLISEFETYSHEEIKDDKNKPENPIKSNDHALDALRYFVLMMDIKQSQLKQFRPKW